MGRLLADPGRVVSEIVCEPNFNPDDLWPLALRGRDGAPLGMGRQWVPEQLRSTENPNHPQDVHGWLNVAGLVGSVLVLERSIVVRNESTPPGRGSRRQWRRPN